MLQLNYYNLDEFHLFSLLGLSPFMSSQTDRVFFKHRPSDDTSLITMTKFLKSCLMNHHRFSFPSSVTVQILCIILVISIVEGAQYSNTRLIHWNPRSTSKGNMFDMMPQPLRGRFAIEPSTTKNSWQRPMEPSSTKKSSWLKPRKLRRFDCYHFCTSTGFQGIIGGCKCGFVLFKRKREKSISFLTD